MDAMTLTSPFSFSRVWEDHRIVSKALGILPEKDTILCITSAGDNVLNLLLEKPKRIVAVDMNPAENALLELKIAAIKQLQYEDYLTLLGDTEDTEQKRELLFGQVKEHMPEYAQKYFNSNTIQNGISTSGYVQEHKIQHITDGISNLVEENDLINFFKAPSMEEQAKCFQKFYSGLEETVLSILTKERMLESGFDENALIRLEDNHGSIGQYFLKNFCRVCLTLPARDNFYLSLWIRGTKGFSPDVNPELAPPFLQRKNFHQLKQLVDRVEIFSSKVGDYMAQPSTPTFNKVYLSNIFDKVTLDSCQSTLQVVVDNMPSGGKMAYCTFVEPNQRPSTATLEKLTYHEDLSVKLTKEDRMPIYSGFHVYSVK